MLAALLQGQKARQPTIQRVGSAHLIVRQKEGDGRALGAAFGVQRQQILLELDHTICGRHAAGCNSESLIAPALCNLHVVLHLTRTGCHRC